MITQLYYKDFLGAAGKVAQSALKNISVPNKMVAIQRVMTQEYFREYNWNSKDVLIRLLFLVFFILHSIDIMIVWWQIREQNMIYTKDDPCINLLSVSRHTTNRIH